MKLLLQLAVIAAFATPVLAHAADISQPNHKVADDAAPKKHKKHGKKKAAASAPATTEAAPAAPAEGGK